MKISISETWQNPYKNGHYSQIDISVSNNTTSIVTIQSIYIVCANQLFPIPNDIVGHIVLEPYSATESKGNDYVFNMLKQQKTQHKRTAHLCLSKLNCVGMQSCHSKCLLPNESYQYKYTLFLCCTSSLCDFISS